MALEGTVNYIDDLNEAWPIGNVDTIDESDNHHRITKAAVKGSFPNLGQAAVTLTAAQINTLQTSTNPIGAIIMYNASFASIPSNWQLCDGTNGTPNMTNKFVYGTNTEGQLKDAGGSANSIVVSHNHTFSGSALPSHTHTAQSIINTQNTGPLGGSGSAKDSAIITDGASAGTPTGTISTDGSSGTNANIPPYIKLAYIQRMT